MRRNIADIDDKRHSHTYIYDISNFLMGIIVSIVLPMAYYKDKRLFDV